MILIDSFNQDTFFLNANHVLETVLGVENTEGNKKWSLPLMVQKYDLNFLHCLSKAILLTIWQRVGKVCREAAYNIFSHIYFFRGYVGLYYPPCTLLPLCLFLKNYFAFRSPFYLLFHFQIPNRMLPLAQFSLTPSVLPLSRYIPIIALNIVIALQLHYLHEEL